MKGGGGREGERLPDPSLSFPVYLGDIQTVLDHENAPNAKKVPLKGDDMFVTGVRPEVYYVRTTHGMVLSEYTHMCTHLFTLART